MGRAPTEPAVAKDAPGYGARFAAEMVRLGEFADIFERARLERLQNLTFDQIAGELHKRLRWLGDDWLAQMRALSPEDFARALVRTECTRRENDSTGQAVGGTIGTVLRLLFLFIGGGV